MARGVASAAPHPARALGTKIGRAHDRDPHPRGRQGWLLERLERAIHPLHEVDPEIARATIEGLEGLDPERGLRVGRCRRAFAAGGRGRSRSRSAREAWLHAYRFAFIGRYPTPNHPLKHEWYDARASTSSSAGALDDPPRPVVRSRSPAATARAPGSTSTSRGPPRRRAAAGRHDLGRDRHLEGGDAEPAPPTCSTSASRCCSSTCPALAVAGARQPGRGAPVDAGLRLARAAQDDLDGERVAVLGASFGGYWAMKLAYTHRERLRAAVNWGGGVHITFTREWQEKSRNASSYLMDLMAARAAIFGGDDVRGLRRPLPGAVAARPGPPRPAVRAAPARQRPPRPPELDRRHLPEPRARRSEVGARLPRRAHGRRPDRADDRRLAAPGGSPQDG